MSWLALHTGPSIDPHCTLAWWPNDQYADTDVQARLIVQDMRREFEGKFINGWVKGYDLFGAPTRPVNVALLDWNPDLMYAVEMAQPLHKSQWGEGRQVPHVTAHDGRQYFRLAYIGLHLPREDHYWRLNGDGRD